MRNAIRTQLTALVGVLFSTILIRSSEQQQVPTTGYCLHIANIFNNLNSKYLDIDASKGLFMNAMLNDEKTENEKWSSKYTFPKLIGSLVQICNDDTNSCLSANKSGQVFLKQGEGDIWYLNFNIENGSFQYRISSKLKLYLRCFCLHPEKNPFFY